MGDTSASGEIRHIAHYYQSGTADLAGDFFVPCLRSCMRYSRAAGYFSSTALKTWSSALVRLIAKNAEIRLIISPIVSTTDATVFRQATSDAERAQILANMGDRIVDEALSYAQDPDNVQLRLRLFAWMLVNERIVVKFAMPRHVEEPGMYHEKFGIFEFPDGDTIAFVGSANETISGHTLNYEKVHVFRSWASEDIERIHTTENDFETEWNGLAPGLLVVPLSKQALHLIRERTPSDRPDLNRKPKENFLSPEIPDPKWRHQEEACESFLKTGAGVIEMATGTGKTRTALKILTKLVSSEKIDGALVTVDGTDLLDQWALEVLTWVGMQDRPFSVLRHYADHHEAHAFALNPHNSILVISRQQLLVALRHITAEDRKRLLIIHDEVHGLGAFGIREALRGQHASIPFRMGLSATPIREYDTTGTQFIESEIGPVIFQFGLKDAIERGILCEFDYVPLAYDLTADDKKRLQAVYSKRAARAAEGNPMSNEEFWTDLSKIYKTADQKPLVFKDFLEDRSDILKASIVFIEEKWYGESILQMIDKYTHRYRTYYADDDRDNLIAFAAGEIDCLITCHRISQGIDIKNLLTVVLFASARSKLETIQRIGRCLRADPSNPAKRAIVVDFVKRPAPSDKYESADDERCQWLTELSAIRRSE